jgi:hypothetical protein
MRTYFIMANLWLAVAYLVILGRTAARNQPTMYSFFGVGGSYHPREYAVLIALPFAMACICLVLFLRSQAGTSSQRDTLAA